MYMEKIIPKVNPNIKQILVLTIIPPSEHTLKVINKESEFKV